MIPEQFVILGALIGFIGTTTYLISTLKGETKPNKVSWFVWSLAPLIAFWAQINQGVGLVSLMTFMVGFGPLLVFLASFVNKKASWKITRLDLICGTLSIIGLILWQMTQVGNIAILFSLLADALAAVPTVIKSYKYPETENYWVYFLVGISSIITLLAIKDWNFETAAFPIYIFLIDLLLFVLIRFKIGKRLEVSSVSSRT
jgi:uncharacterized membrane protein